MKPSLEGSRPTSQTDASQTAPRAQSESFNQGRPESPSADTRGVPHTPPLPPAIKSPVRSSSNPLDEFSQEESNLIAADRCLAAACSLLQFEIAEVWTYAGDFNADEGKAVEPMCLHVYVRPATIESFKADVQGVWETGNKATRHTLSPLLVDEARKKEELVWYTSVHPNTPLHANLPLNTAVSLPVSLSMFRRDLCFVFFAQRDVKRQDMAVSVLTELSKAAGIAISSQFPAVVKADGSHYRTARSLSRPVENEITTSPSKQVKKLPLRLDLSIGDLHDIELMANGSRCTIYTAFYGATAVVVKVMRKDVGDKDLVRQELDLEMSLLMRLDHPSIVRLIGAGKDPEPFLLIERLDGGTLAQRCGNALEIRDRRKRFKHKRPFTYEELLRQGLQLAQGLRYMHHDAMPGKLVMHRDLKPDNVGFDSNGNLKLIDLGLGRVVAKDSDETAVYQLTGETGSLRYMAPEVALGKPYNGAADVYGFSMILWEMATMTKPFGAMGRDQFFHDVVGGGVRPHVKNTWPRQFAELLEACWDPDMKQRLRFDEIIPILKSLLDTAAETAAQARSVQRPRKFGIFKASKKNSKGTFE